MPTVTRSPTATKELRRIVDHIAVDNPVAADQWLDEMSELFELLASQPLIGQLLRSRGRRELRRHSHGNYVIYYRPVHDGVQIVHVMHGAREQ